MSTEEMYVAICHAIATAFAVVVVSIAGCVSYETHEFAKATVAGNNPIDMACAMNRLSRDLCILRAAKHQP